MQGIRTPKSLRQVHVTAGASLLGALAATVVAGPAMAQEIAAADVSGVTVVRRRPNLPPTIDAAAPYKADLSASGKLTQPLLDTPRSVTVLTEDLFDDLGAMNFRDLMRTQPGVTLGTGEGGNAHGDRIFIRGFDARNDVYIDGVRDPGVGARELFGVEQIEILKGPSSTIGGRGTTGGAVSLISKQPLAMNFGDLEGVYGDDGTRRVTLDTSRRIGERLGVRLNAMYTEAGVAGRNAVFNDRWGWAAAVSYDLTDALEIGADYYHLSTDEMPDFGVPYDLANNRPFQVDRNNFYGVVARDFRETFADIYTGRAAWTFSDSFKLDTLFRYGQTLNKYTASAPERPDVARATVSANPKRRDAVTEVFANQTNLTARFATGPIAHALVAGFEISDEKVNNRGRAFVECAVLPCVGAATPVLHNLYAPDPYVRREVLDNGLTNRTHIKVDSRAIYAIDTLTFSPRWQATVGVRRDSYDIGFRQISFATGAVAERSNETAFWNGQVAVTFKPVANASLYAAFGTSSNPSGEQLDSLVLDYGGLDPRTAALDPERNNSYELGAKWNVFDEHLSLTAAAFQIDKSNARVAIDATTVELIGGQRAKGIEFGVVGAVNPRWQVAAGVTYVDAKVTSSPIAGQSGAQFPNVPKVSWSATSKYAVTRRVTLGATATHQSRRYGGTTVALTTSIPGYTRYDLFGSFQITRRFLIDVNILNVTDKVYYDALYRSATPFTYIAPGRSFLIKADYHF